MLSIKARLAALERIAPPPPAIVIRDVVPAGEGRFHADLVIDGKATRFALRRNCDGTVEEVTP